MQYRKSDRFKGSTVLLTLAVVQFVSTQFLLFEDWSATFVHATQAVQSLKSLRSDCATKTGSPDSLCLITLDAYSRW